MSRSVFIGIDGGGGTTECILADYKGRILGKGLSDGSNIFSSGEYNVARALKESLSAAGLLKDDKVISACFGLSGVIYGLENKAINRVVKELLPETEKILVVNDAITALTGSIGTGVGICINSGTGVICAGRNVQGELAISSGWGHLLGDEGSGYWIGSQGLISALRGYDGRSPNTILIDKLLQSMGTDSPFCASKIIHESENPRVIISNLCPVVFECAEKGDVIALDIVKRAGYELALTVLSVAKKLSLTECNINVSPVGNCLMKNDLLKESFSEVLEELLPFASIKSPKYAPSVGSLLMALMEGGIDTELIDMKPYAHLTSKGRNCS